MALGPIQLPIQRLRGFFLTDKAAEASRRPLQLVPRFPKLRMSGVTPLHTHTHTHTYTSWRGKGQLHLFKGVWYSPHSKVLFLLCI